MGVHRTVDVTAEDPVAVVAGLHYGLGADLVVDATGVSAALRQGLELVARRGRSRRSAGARSRSTSPSIPWSKGRHPLRLLFAYVVNLGNVLRLFGSGGLDPKAALGSIYSIEDWGEAFSAMERGDNIKSVLAPHGGSLLGAR